MHNEIVGRGVVCKFKGPQYCANDLKSCYGHKETFLWKDNEKNDWATVALLELL